MKLVRQAWPLLCLALALPVPLSLGMVDLDSSELLRVQGKVEIRKGQDSAFKPVPSNLQLAGSLRHLEAGDEIKTQPNSTAEISLRDTCVIVVQEKSIFKIPPAMDSSRLLKLEAEQGSFLFKVVSGSDFSVQTADLVAGVKGTLFQVDAVEDFTPILTLPGLALGSEQEGSTLIEVYEGDVEVTHADTKKSRHVLAGHRMLGLRRRLTQLDQELQDGFGPTIELDALPELDARFGGIGKALFGAKATHEEIGRLDLSSTPPKRSRGSRADRGEHLFKGWSDKLKGKLHRLAKIKKKAGAVKNKLQKLKERLKQGQLPLPLPPAPGGRPTGQAGCDLLTEPLDVEPGQVREACVDDGLSIVLGASSGGEPLKAFPDLGGLVLDEGFGSFRIVDSALGLNAMVSVQQTPEGSLTILQMQEGMLQAMLQGQAEPLDIEPGTTVAFAYDAASGASRKLETAPPPAFEPAVLEHRLGSEAPAADEQNAKKPEKIEDEKQKKHEDKHRDKGQNDKGQDKKDKRKRDKPS